MCFKTGTLTKNEFLALPVIWTMANAERHMQALDMAGEYLPLSQPLDYRIFKILSIWVTF